MIKLLGTSGESVTYEPNVKKQTVSLYADTKSEVTNSITGADVEGMNDDVDLDAGSIVRTAAFDIACLNSSHVWVWK